VIKRGISTSCSPLYTLQVACTGSPLPKPKPLAPRGSLKLDARVQMPRRGGVARARANVPMRVHHARVLPAHGDSLPPARAREPARQPAKLGHRMVGGRRLPERRRVPVGSKARVDCLAVKVGAAPLEPLAHRVAQPRAHAEALELGQHDCAVRALWPIGRLARRLA